MNDSPANDDKPNRLGFEWFFVFTIAFGCYLLFKGDANNAQLIFRYGLIGFGVIGLAVYSIVKASKKNRDE